MPNTKKIRASASAVLLLAGLAGCVNSSVSPRITPATAAPTTSPTSAPSTSPSASASPSSSASPSTVAATWTLGGSTANLVATQGQTPAPLTLSAYNNITASLQFVTAASGSATLNASDALNTGDVAPNTLPADNATTGATPVIYFSLYNGTTTDVSFGTSTPTVTITNTAGFGGATTCEFDVYANNGGSGPTWNNIGASGTVSGTSVTINSVTLSGITVDFAPGQQMTAVACK